MHNLDSRVLDLISLLEFYVLACSVAVAGF